MFLRKSDIAELTGYKTRQGQIKILSENGVKYFIARDGWPRVHEREVLSHGTEEKEPNYAALKMG